jgi:hypothetical protein
VNGNLGSGLVLIGAGIAVFLGWYSGAFTALIDDVTGRVRSPKAGTKGIPGGVPAPAPGTLESFGLRAPPAPRIPSSRVS